MGRRFEDQFDEVLLELHTEVLAGMLNERYYELQRACCVVYLLHIQRATRATMRIQAQVWLQQINVRNEKHWACLRQQVQYDEACDQLLACALLFARSSRCCCCRCRRPHRFDTTFLLLTPHSSHHWPRIDFYKQRSRLQFEIFAISKVILPLQVCKYLSL